MSLGCVLLATASSSTTAECAVWLLRVCRTKRGNDKFFLNPSRKCNNDSAACATAAAPSTGLVETKHSVLPTLSAAAVQLHSLTFRLQGYCPDVPNRLGPQRYGPFDHFL